MIKLKIGQRVSELTSNGLRSGKIIFINKHHYWYTVEFKTPRGSYRECFPVYGK